MSGEMDQIELATRRRSMHPAPMYGSPPLAGTMVRMIVPLDAPSRPGGLERSTRAHRHERPLGSERGAPATPRRPHPIDASARRPAGGSRNRDQRIWAPHRPATPRRRSRANAQQLRPTVPNFACSCPGPLLSPKSRCSAESSSKLHRGHGHRCLRFRHLHCDPSPCYIQCAIHDAGRSSSILLHSRHESLRDSVLVCTISRAAGIRPHRVISVRRVGARTALRCADSKLKRPFGFVRQRHEI